MKDVRVALLLSWILLPHLLFGTGAAKDPQLAYFQDLAETRNYTLGLPTSARFTPDAKSVLYLRSGARNPVLHLYELDLQTLKEREVLTPAQLLKGAEEVLSAEERARRERARVSLRGFTQYDLSRDGSRLLVALSGKLYVVSRADLAVVELPGVNWIDPQFSPDGKYVAACAGGELHVIEVLNRTARQVTHGATETLSNGVAEFVAQEEMDRRHGYWWSPDSSSLAFQQTDETGVEVRYVSDPLHPEARPERFFYPRAGTPNARVRLGVVSREGGPVQWIDWDRETFPYLARVSWQPVGAPLTILVQSRSQQHQQLLAVDHPSAAPRVLLEERDPAWLELDWDARTPRWLPGGKEFLWTTESRGTWQVELRGADGRLLRVLTPPEFRYRGLVGFDAGAREVYLHGSNDPREIQLWRFSLDGSAASVITQGFGQHRAAAAPEGKLFLDSYELDDGRSGVDILNLSGTHITSLPSVAETPKQWPSVEFVRTQTDPALDAALIRPQEFRSDTQYPVILSVYAGPTLKRVTAGKRTYFPDQWLADQGYIVVRIDGRGTPWQGRDWQRVIRGNFIDVALEDQVAGLRALGRQFRELDLTRVGVTGWSFGGYFTAMATLRRPDVFRCGVSGAPVITWENYDTHYTERYLGLPQENAEAYRISNVTTYASQLERPLLLIHGLTDDNVYFQHTLQLADALFQAGKPYELLPLLGTHMVSDPLIRLRQQTRILEFFDRNLKPPLQGANR